MKRSFESPIVLLTSRLITPFLQLFSLYVLFHGHYSPGGGFQGGAMLAASIILMRLASGEKAGQLQFKRKWGSRLSAAGVFIYAFVGIITLLYGGYYLDYKFLPLPGMSDAEIRAMGILFVEIGVAICVMATLVSIFDDLVEEQPND